MCGRQVEGAQPAPPGGHSVEQPDFLNLKEEEEDSHESAPSLHCSTVYRCAHVTSGLTNTPFPNAAPKTLADCVADAIRAP